MKILDRLPIPMTRTPVFVGAESVHLKEAEIIVWISLAPAKAVTWNPTTPRFPAILDTGNTHNFAIQEQHLIRWAGIRPEMVRLLGHIRHAGQRIPLRAINLWLHRNEPGQSAVSTSQHLLVLPRGIAVYPDGVNYPRLPLVGFRAILSNSLHLAIDGEQKVVNLRTPDWRTWLSRWLA
jgi:hypothetical protein